TPDDAREHVAPQLVGAEQVRRARRAAHLAPARRQGIVRREPGREHGGEDEEHHHCEPEHRAAATAQTFPGFSSWLGLCILKNNGRHQCLIRGLTKKYARSASRLSMM